MELLWCLGVGAWCFTHSLGVLLYELLTGQTPFDAEKLVAFGLDEIRRIIREQEPPKPSTRLTQELVAADVRRLKSPETTEEEVRASSRRLLQVKELIPLLRGDLDWLVMKCLEKDRSRRYETANALAMDLQRHLNNEPVVACPPSRSYRFQRLVRRNKLAFAATAAIVTALVLGVVVSTWQAIRATQAEREEQKAHADEARQRQRAEQERERAEGALTQMEIQRAEDLFAAGNPSTALAYLARVLRKNSTNQLVAQRIISALTERSFALPLVEPLHHAGAISFAEFSPNGELAVTASADSMARIWDARTGQPLTGPLKHEADVLSAEFSPDGQRLATTSSNTCRIWDVRSARLLTGPLQHKGAVLSARFSPDGEKLATASTDNAAWLWDARSGKAWAGPLEHEGEVRFAQFSPDGQLLVTASSDGTARLWNARSGESLTKPLRHNAIVRRAQFSPDGQRVVTVSLNAARIWDAHTGQLLTGPLLHHFGYGPVYVAEFSPSGAQIVTASGDGTAIVWDARSGQRLFGPLAHDGEVSCARFSPDGGRVVTASLDHTARVWDARTGHPLTGSLQHERDVVWAHFSSDGQRVITASLDKTARIWEAGAGQALPRQIKCRTERRVRLFQFG